MLAPDRRRRNPGDWGASLVPERQLTSEAIIKVRDLSYSYPGEISALRSVNLDILPGEFVAIIGSNGSGKTTLVKQFNGLLKPSQGHVLVDGLDTRSSRVSELSRIVGFVFQNPDHQIFAYSVWEEASFGLKLQKLDSESVEQQTSDALKAVSLDGLRDRHPRALSRGQRQRLATASILALNTPVLVLDEPTTGQDYLSRRQIMELAVGLHAEGRTVLMVTHDMALVAEYATRVIVMQDGEVACDASPKEVFEREEMLRATGLDLPPVVKIARGLREFGFSDTPLTQAELVETLLTAIRS